MTEEWPHTVNDSFVNPDPIVLEESEIIINDFLSPIKLQEISGKDDLKQVTSLEMVVDTRETTLGNFGQYLPLLAQLKLSDSVIPSVRDIGTSLSKLTVLWMSRCGLTDIDGIASIQSLKELYVAYNNIEDVSPISFLESLEVLDLEGNKIEDIEQLDYLALIANLSVLTLTGNPICQIYQEQCNRSCPFREVVLEKMPQLQLLDDEGPSTNGVDVGARPSTATSSHSQEDIDIITNAIKEGIFDTQMPTFLSNGNLSPEPNRPSRTNRPRPATAGVRNSPIMSLADSIPASVIKPRPGSSGSESGILQQDDSSSLTFGDPLCGNPVNALRNRKKVQHPGLPLFTETFQLPSSGRPTTAIGIRQRPLKVDLNLHKLMDKRNTAADSANDHALFSKTDRDDEQWSSTTAGVSASTPDSVDPSALSSPLSSTVSACVSR